VLLVMVSGLLLALLRRLERVTPAVE
jgi:hypothetical protein